MLNKQSGNMYGFVTHTFNTIKGRCEHGCIYCYMLPFALNPVRFDEKELKTDLSAGNFIFVGSGCDMFAAGIPTEWIRKTINHCHNYPDNRYLFQTKNPERFIGWKFPKNTVLVTTIESNINYNISNAPSIENRISAMAALPENKMITIEPIIKFDLEKLVEMVRSVGPVQVNIGADSKGHHLEEPTGSEIQALIDALNLHTTVFLKDNLKRLCTTIA